MTSELAGIVTNGFAAANQARDGSFMVMSGPSLLRIDNNRVLSRTELPDVIKDVWRLDEDREGVVSVSTMESGLYRISPTGMLRHYGSTNGLACDPLRCTFADREHNLWVGTSGGGLQRFKPRSFIGYDLESGLPERNIRAVIEEAAGKILVGTYGKGVVRLQGGRATRPPTPGFSPASSYVQSLLGRSKWQRDLWTRIIYSRRGGAAPGFYH